MSPFQEGYVPNLFDDDPDDEDHNFDQPVDNRGESPKNPDVGNDNKESETILSPKKPKIPDGFDPFGAKGGKEDKRYS